MNAECRSNGKLDNFDNFANIDSKFPSIPELNEAILTNVKICCIERRVTRRRWGLTGNSGFNI
ncbi:MAG: hypothetical protein ACTS41_00600 [Candidatus Hodgkinia cicadicola]